MNCKVGNLKSEIDSEIHVFSFDLFLLVLMMFERRRQIVLRRSSWHGTYAIGFDLFSKRFFMILALDEQNCDSHGAFQANVSIEDARCRGTSL